MSNIPRVIVYAKPDEMILVARMASRLMSPDYEWKDGWAYWTFGALEDQPWKGLSFSARRNKSGFTIYSQQLSRGELTK